VSSLDGAVVALFEARMSTELAALVRRHGGEPYLVPAVRERPLAGGPELDRALSKLFAGEFDIVVFLTGIGVRRLFEEARRSDCLEAAQSALTQLTVVCRGPKPIAALKEESIPVSYAVPSPHTTRELLAVLSSLPLEGQHVLVVHAGELMPEPAGMLRLRGAHVMELQLYQWELSKVDAANLREFMQHLLLAEIDALAFTSQIQVRHFFQIVDELDARKEVERQLRDRIAVAAVGPTCAEALRANGIEPDVVPGHPKMGTMIVALARHFSSEKETDSNRKDSNPTPKCLS
jgi:uroporphyrinogen-III synthase